MSAYPNLLTETKLDIQQASIPNKKEKLIHQAILLLTGLCRKSQQHHWLIQQIQLKTHTIILTPAQAEKK